VIEGGIPFKLRRLNLLEDVPMVNNDNEETKASDFNMNRTKDIPDEMLMR
jgi:hypothetical protein